MQACVAAGGGVNFPDARLARCFVFSGRRAPTPSHEPSLSLHSRGTLYPATIRSGRCDSLCQTQRVGGRGTNGPARTPAAPPPLSRRIPSLSTRAWPLQHSPARPARRTAGRAARPATGRGARACIFCELALELAQKEKQHTCGLARVGRAARLSDLSILHSPAACLPRPTHRPFLHAHITLFSLYFDRQRTANTNKQTSLTNKADTVFFFFFLGAAAVAPAAYSAPAPRPFPCPLGEFDPESDDEWLPAMLADADAAPRAVRRALVAAGTG